MFRLVFNYDAKALLYVHNSMLYVCKALLYERNSMLYEIN